MSTNSVTEINSNNTNRKKGKHCFNMFFKGSCFDFEYFLLWLMVLLIIGSTSIIESRTNHEVTHMRNFSNSATLSKECKVRYDLEQTVYYNEDYYFMKNWVFGINCDISSSRFNFKFDEKNKCLKRDEYIFLDFYMQLTFSKSRNLILGNWFQFDNLIKFVVCYNESWWIRFRNLKGFDLNMFENSNQFISVPLSYTFYMNMELTNFEFSFYSDGKLIKSCDEIVRQN